MGPADDFLPVEPDVIELPAPRKPAGDDDGAPGDPREGGERS
jgi:hypothetical protein